MNSLTDQQSLDMAVRHHQAGRLADAEALYAQILARNPNHAGALHLMGVLAHQAGRHDVGHDLIARAISIQPGVAQYHMNFAVVLAALGRVDEAIDEYQRSLQIDPNYLGAMLNLARALLKKGRIVDSIALGRRVAAIQPNWWEAANVLGNALFAGGLLDEAGDQYARAVALSPQSFEPINNLANVKKETDELAEALELYRRAVDLPGATPEPLSQLIYSMQYDPDVTAADILREARRFDQRFTQPLAALSRPFPNERDPGRRLRIGYVSADFSQHVVSWNLLPILENHDHENFEIFCYSGVLNPDEMTEKLRAQADHWRPITGMHDQLVADMVRQDGIDILIDLTGHYGGNRLGVFARKPAPIQIVYLGYNATTGLSAMDYRISDPFMDDLSTEKDYVEKTLYLPHSYWCYRPGGEAPPVAPSPMELAGRVTFASLNNFAKISIAARKVWAEILLAVKDSRLVMHCQPGRHLEEVRRKFSGWGIDPERIEYLGKKLWPEHMKTYDRIDIALDPFPHGGGITTCDALWMGVPVVTLAGKTPVGRAGKSILSNIGLADLAVETPEQYVEIAARLAGDLPRLKELRRTMRDRMTDSPLMNAKQFARDLESAFRAVWGQWCTGEKR